MPSREMEMKTKVEYLLKLLAYDDIKPLSRRGNSDYSVGHFNAFPRSSGNDIQAELELTFFLFGLCLLTKPKLVLESGADLGSSTRALGLACKLNGFGEVLSAEIDPEKAKFAQSICAGLPVTVRQEDSKDLPWESADLAFIDGAWENRLAELDRLKKAIAVIHDTKAKPLEVWSWHVDYQAVEIPTPRGVAVVRIV